MIMSLATTPPLVQRVESKTVIRKQIMTGRDAKNIASLANDLGSFIHAFTPERGLITPENNPYTEHESVINGVPTTVLDFAELLMMKK